jgi:hypothetical protein
MPKQNRSQLAIPCAPEFVLETHSRCGSWRRAGKELNTLYGLEVHYLTWRKYAMGEQKEYRQIKPTVANLKRCGVERLSIQKDKHYRILEIRLRCMTCGCEWSPNVTAGRLANEWWWCKTDEEHTKAKARTDAGRLLKKIRDEKALALARMDNEPKQQPLL